MENVLALTSTKSLIPAGSAGISDCRRPAYPTPAGRSRRSSRVVSSQPSRSSGSGFSQTAWEKLELQNFASISSSINNVMSRVKGFQTPMTFPTPYFGSPLLWIGVGVGLSALFSVMATKFKRAAIRKAFKSVMNEAAPQDGQFNNVAFSPGSPSPIPTTSPWTLTSSPQIPTASEPITKMDAPAIKVDTFSPISVDHDETEISKEAKNCET